MPVQQTRESSKHETVVDTPRLLLLILPVLILITSFLVFLRHNFYCLACAETWISFGGIIFFALLFSLLMIVGGRMMSGVVVSGLMTIFIDIQFIPEGWIVGYGLLLFVALETFGLCWFLKEKFYVIVTSVFATFFLVTLLQLALTYSKNDVPFEHRRPYADSPTRIIHLIFDEHIGIEGIPTDIKGGSAIRNLITEFFRKNGFQLFGGAFSHYFNTHNSISNMLNFSAESKDSAYLRGVDPYRLLHNKYFEMLSEQKYHIEVLSPGYINFCSDTTVVNISCSEYKAENLRTFAKLEIPISQKLQVLLSRFLGQSSILSWITYLSTITVPAILPPQWAWAFDHERTRMHPLNTLANLDALWNSILSLPQGTALFAHLLIPHYPYVAQADCLIRPPSREYLWKTRGLLTQPSTNTIASREERYQLYFQQLECLYLRLDKLFNRMRAAGIYDNSIIILHGDHGSKIAITDSISENRDSLTKQDLVDGFSTLFATKFPGRSGIYDASTSPLEQLFAKFVLEAGLTSYNIALEQSKPFVYLTAAHDNALLRIPYPLPE